MANKLYPDPLRRQGGVNVRQGAHSFTFLPGGNRAKNFIDFQNQMVSIQTTRVLKKAVNYVHSKGYFNNAVCVKYSIFFYLHFLYH